MGLLPTIEALARAFEHRVFIAAERGPARLKRRFRDAGRLSGRSREYIIAVVGRPDSVARAPGEGVLFSWKRKAGNAAYEVVLMFDAEGRCLGISHEVDTAV